MKKAYVVPEMKLFQIGADERIASTCSSEHIYNATGASDCTLSGQFEGLTDQCYTPVTGVS